MIDKHLSHQGGKLMMRLMRRTLQMCSSKTSDVQLTTSDVHLKHIRCECGMTANSPGTERYTSKGTWGNYLSHTCPFLSLNACQVLNTGCVCIYSSSTTKAASVYMISCTSLMLPSNLKCHVHAWAAKLARAAHFGPNCWPSTSCHLNGLWQYQHHKYVAVPAPYICDGTGTIYICDSAPEKWHIPMSRLKSFPPLWETAFATKSDRLTRNATTDFSVAGN